MWFAIAVTVLAASGNNIGKVLQKQATRTLPRLTLKREVVQQYLQSKTWVAGMLTDLAGALLMLVAFANAPVSVVQPVSAVGLVVLLIFSHFYLKERLRFHEWIAAAVAGVGVIGLGMSAEPDHMTQPTASPIHIVAAFLALVALLGVECWWRHWLHGPSSRPSASGGSSFKGMPAHNIAAGLGGGPQAAAAAAASAAAAADAAMCGLEAGTCFGLSAASCRTGFILANKVSVLWVPLGLGCSVALTTSGFILQTRGLKAGNTIIVCTLAAVASMVSGVVAGLIALHEQMPSAHGMKVVRLGSWMCIMLGVTSLAGGRKGLSTLAKLAAAWLPSPESRAWRRIPRPLALLLHKLEKSVMDGDDDGDEKLPLVEPSVAVSTSSTVASGNSSTAGQTVFVLPVSGDSLDRGLASEAHSLPGRHQS